ncbi:acyl-CoA N-acyltransferase [Hygrophoropsis aurantiaca]|uniref:Acyl-CoA N-acyltransferase n=1 Tax=Hygrophoropsis aurantiaca TaxID=72124 RepID=A0ACB7ZTJ8_9AGAM|nr:acyl-CoA N-acyltransferase [Hygrophoropsis aurantiaca]
MTGMMMLMSRPGISAVAEDNRGRIVGYVLARIKNSTESDGAIHGHVGSISVLRSHRRQGIARKLLTLSLRVMAEKYKTSHVTLNVRKSNAGARALYEAIGFKSFVSRKPFYADGESAVGMIIAVDQIVREQLSRRYMLANP